MRTFIDDFKSPCTRSKAAQIRNALLREATRLGLSGWVRNRSDGSVEALAAGPAPALDGLIAWARRGPTAARVSEVSWEATQAPVEAGFYREETL